MLLFFLFLPLKLSSYYIFCAKNNTDSGTGSENWKCQSLSCVQLCDSMDCSPPGSSVHGILQAKIQEWVAIPFSKGIF